MLELKIANIGAMPTYVKGEKSSIVDLIFVDPRLSVEGSYWQISDRYTSSEHRALTYQLHLTSRTANMTRMPKREKWSPATFDRETFLCFLKGTSAKEQQLRLGFKVSRGPSQRHAMLRCPQRSNGRHWYSRANSSYRIRSEDSGQKYRHKKGSKTGWHSWISYKDRSFEYLLYIQGNFQYLPE